MDVECLKKTNKLRGNVVENSSLKDDFDEDELHDNCIHALQFCHELYESNFIFDIDHIVEWIPSSDGCRFKVVPALLKFFHVTDLVISIEWGNSGFQNSEGGLFITGVRREPVETKLKLATYYHWLLHLNDSEQVIHFGASGYALEFRSDPIIIEEQSFHYGERMKLIKGGNRRGRGQTGR